MDNSEMIQAIAKSLVSQYPETTHLVNELLIEADFRSEILDSLNLREAIRALCNNSIYMNDNYPEDDQITLETLMLAHYAEIILNNQIQNYTSKNPIH